MTQLILIILGVAIIVILMTKKTREAAVGICLTALGRDVKKRENKEKILTLLAGKSSTSAQGSGETKELSNSDIREALGISERTAVRYMDELEREGKVEQIGSTGRSVAYRLK